MAFSSSLNQISQASTKSMAKSTLAFLIIILLLLTGPPPSESLSYYQYRTLFSLSHSLLTRVANLRAARGDLSGANRVRVMAAKLERGMGLGFWPFMWSAGWDYVRNYAWTDLPSSELFGVVSDSNELLRLLGELTRTDSDVDRAAWVGRNYQNVLRVSRSLLGRLFNVFRQTVRHRFDFFFFLYLFFIYEWGHLI